MALAERLGADARHQRWNQLYADYHRLALETALHRVGNTADAEDVAQKTFIDAYEILARGEDVTNWEAMIVTIAKRAAGKAKVRRNREVELEADRSVDGAPDEATAERKQQFQKVFRTLTQGEQKAVYYTLVEGLTAKEVGERLGTGTESAKHLVSRGRAALALEIVARNDATDESTACARPMAVICRYLANRMNPGERSDFRSHMKECLRCRLTVERVRDFRGFVLLLVPAGLATLQRDELYARIQEQPTAARISRGGAKLRLLGGGLLLLLVIGAVVATHRPMTGTPAIAATACRTGQLGGFGYLDNGNVMYRSSPQATPQLIDGSGGADALLWTPDGTTLVYKVARVHGLVSGSLHAVHPGSTPFWSFGTGVESFALSPDGASIAAIAEHTDSAGNWDGWTLYIGSVGGKMTAHTESALVVPGGPGWRDSPSGEPLVESNYVPIPGNYWGVFWLGSAIDIAQGGEYSSFDTSGNPTSTGWAPVSTPLQTQIAAIGQPQGSAVHFTQRGVEVTATCGGSTRAIVAGPHFTENSSNTLMLDDTYANARAGLAVESSDGASGGDIYLVTADGRVVALTSDHSAYLPMWQPMQA